jgi:hypothetical protein
MALPHYSQDQTSRAGRQFEPVQANLFEVTILPPAGVANAPLMLQHINSIGGLDLYKELPVMEQKYKWSQRSYSGVPAESVVNVTINFSLNLNEANQAYVYKTLKQWYNSQYNPQTGVMGLKKDYVGTIVVVQFNRAGDIYRTVTLEDCFISSGLPFTNELNYETAEAASLEVGFRCDTWKEVLA